MLMVKQIIEIQLFLKEIVPGFLESRHNDLPVLDLALKNKDHQTIRHLGHKMKGSSGSYGFVTLSDIGSNLESAAEKLDFTKIENEIKKMKEYLSSIEIKYVE